MRYVYTGSASVEVYVGSDFLLRGGLNASRRVVLESERYLNRG